MRIDLRLQLLDLRISPQLGFNLQGGEQALGFEHHVVKAFEQSIELVNRILADPGAVVSLLYLIELLAKQMYIPVEIPVEHQNNDQANNQNDENASHEYLLIPVQRIQEIAHPCIRHKVRVNRLNVFRQHIIVVPAGVIVKF
ncbi:hypothetical protein D3C81_1293320 [compost metagenome]